MKDLEKYIPMVKFIASILGENCEVVLHDVRDPENSILSIENSHISGRQVGGVLTDLVLKTVQDKKNRNQDFIANYVVVTKDNRRCQSSSFFIRDHNEKIIAVLCVNIDISEFLRTKDFLDQFIRIKLPKDSIIGSVNISQVQEENDAFEGNEVIEHLLETPSDVVNHLLGKVLNNLDIPVERMSQEEKIEVVRKLNEAGLFMFKGGVGEVAKRLKASEATVYRYLHKVKEDYENT